MGSQGLATRLKPASREPDAVNIYVLAKWWKGRRCIVTEFEIDGETTVFYVGEDQAKVRLSALERQIVAEIRNDEASGESIISNLHVLGRDLTDLLLQQDDPETSRQAQDRVARALSSSAGPIIYRLGGPVPVELLTFATTIGGVGAFSRMLGGRAAARVQSGTRVGLVVGSGAVYFHDDMTDSVREGVIDAALSVAFGTGIELHGDLLNRNREAAYREIERLFQGGTASWVHFQCHSIENQLPKRLRLTNNFEVDRYRFRKPGPQVAAIMLNTCSASRSGTSWSTTDSGTESSWSEYFTSECGVPAVIGPSCAVLDQNTVPFTRAFYAELSREPRVFAAFAKARESCLARDDYTALVYRYLGPGSLMLPESSRVPVYMPELNRAA